MIENVLEIKDTHVREVMTPLVDVVAIDASSTLIDFHNLWVTHQYSRYSMLLYNLCLQLVRSMLRRNVCAGYLSLKNVLII